MHDPGSVRGRDSGRLRGRDRRHRQVREAREEQRPVELVNSPVHRRETVAAACAEERRVRELAVAMHDVELVEAQPQRLELQRVERRRDARRDPTVAPFQGGEARVVADAWQVCRTVGGCEQRYLRTQETQRRAEVVDDPFRAAVMLGGNGEDVGGDLGDADHGRDLTCNVSLARSR